MSKKKFKTILCGCITALCLFLTSCGSLQISQGSGNQDSGHRNQTTAETTFASTGQIESVDTLEEVPEYTGQPYVEINDNEPSFTKEELTTDSYEEYSPLDELGRCQTAEACVGEDLMPTQKRESISSVKPTGWVNKEYDGIDGGYLYNRCHLIGFQLTGENANERNLITGTRYMNVDGMLPFEDEVADYVVRELGYIEVSPSDETYQTEYSNMRASFLLQYRLELLGDLTEPQRPQQWDEKSVMEFMKQIEQRTEAARAVPKTEFDIDFHLYRKTGWDFEMSISIEKTYESFSGSASGSKRVMRRYGADFRKVYRYYGVSQEDIRQRTKRFEEVVRQLTVR